VKAFANQKKKKKKSKHERLGERNVGFILGVDKLTVSNPIWGLGKQGGEAQFQSHTKRGSRTLLKVGGVSLRKTSQQIYE